MSSRFRGPLRSVALVCSIALAACGDSGSLILGSAGGGDAALVRFTNATGSTLDLAQSGVVTAGNANIAPGSSVGCLAVEDPTTSTLSARVSGTTTSLAGFPATFAVGGRYTVVAYLGPSSTIQFISIPITTTPAVDRSALRVFNGSSALSAVDVYATAPGAALTVPIISSLNFGVTSSTVDLAPGSIQIRLTTTGTLNVVFDAGTQVLESGKSYTLVVSSATPTAVLVPDC